MMLSNEEIKKIIDERGVRLDQWLKNKPETLSLSTLKKEVKKWREEIAESIKLDNENEKHPEQSKENLTFVYHFMNIFSAYRCRAITQGVYIKKLEKYLSKFKPKN